MSKKIILKATIVPELVTIGKLPAIKIKKENLVIPDLTPMLKLLKNMNEYEKQNRSKKR